MISTNEPRFLSELYKCSKCGETFPVNPYAFGKFPLMHGGPDFGCGGELVRIPSGDKKDETDS